MLGLLPSIKINYVPENCVNRPREPLTATSVTIHNTANPTSTAQNERDWVANPTNKGYASFHYAVDQTQAVAVIPENEVAWHAGSKAGNYSSIGIESCESGDLNIVWKKTVGLTAKILYERGWGVDKVKRHYDWTGKDCPRLIMPKWTQFIADVQETLDLLNKVPSTVIKKVRVTAGTLNVRPLPDGGNVWIGSYPAGTELNVYEEYGTWYMVGKNQWVVAGYTEPVLPPDPNAWKYDGIDRLHAAGLLDDIEGWKKKIDEPMPVWATMLLMARIAERIK